MVGVMSVESVQPILGQRVTPSMPPLVILIPLLLRKGVMIMATSQLLPPKLIVKSENVEIGLIASESEKEDEIVVEVESVCDSMCSNESKNLQLMYN